jgi:hypothetical protein
MNLDIPDLGDLSELKAVQHFIRTAILKSDAADVAVELLGNDQVGEGKKAYITDIIVKVNGGTAWSGGSFTKLLIQDKNSSPVNFAEIAVAGLTANAVIVKPDGNLTLANAIALALGGTAWKGVEIVGDDAAGAGSDLHVTVTGYIK